jgi:hypothetical protein
MSLTTSKEVPAKNFARFFLQDFAERVLLVAIYMSNTKTQYLAAIVTL